MSTRILNVCTQVSSRCLFVVFLNAGNQVQNLAYARKVLYHCVETLVLFLSFIKAFLWIRD